MTLYLPLSVLQYNTVKLITLDCECAAPCALRLIPNISFIGDLNDLFFINVDYLLYSQLLLKSSTLVEFMPLNHSVDTTELDGQSNTAYLIVESALHRGSGSMTI